MQDCLPANAVCALPDVCALSDGFRALQATPGLEAGPRSNTATSSTDVSDVDLGGLLLDVEASLPLPGAQRAAAAGCPPA